jgi:hypothetical protein
VAIFKPSARYTPTPVPQAASPDLRRWLREEIDSIAFAIDGLTDEVDRLASNPRMYLFRDADDLLLSPVDVKITGYQEWDSVGNVPIEPNPVTGEIVIPEDGTYSGTAFVYGIQGSADQNQEIHLLFDIVGPSGIIRYPVAMFDVATRLTTSRVLNGSLTGILLKGDVVSLWMNATADLGIFSMQQTTFELLRVR